jgi:hypothetical protein
MLFFTIPRPPFHVACATIRGRPASVNSAVTFASPEIDALTLGDSATDDAIVEFGSMDVKRSARRP